MYLFSYIRGLLSIVYFLRIWSESDFRVILNICIALNDPELNDQQKACVALRFFYPQYAKIKPAHHEEALKQCFWFIDGGEAATQPTGPKLISWEQDVKLIVAPVNRILGKEVRELEYLHWWSFMAAYYEIGECLFSQVVSIRSKRAKGKKLDKHEQEFYKQNRGLMDIKTAYSSAEDDFLKQWGAKQKPPRRAA
jgi:hypothetical protein